MNTLKCLNIGTPKTINFPFAPNGKLIFLGVPIFEQIIIRLYFAQILGHLKIINFTFGKNEKFIAFRCPNIFKHITVCAYLIQVACLIKEYRGGR